MKNWILPHLGRTQSAVAKVAAGAAPHLHTGLDVDGGDLLDDLGGRVQVDDPLVDPHLELVPGLGALT
jgi:hypothetical protein